MLFNSLIFIQVMLFSIFAEQEYDANESFHTNIPYLIINSISIHLRDGVFPGEQT